MVDCGERELCCPTLVAQRIRVILRGTDRAARVGRKAEAVGRVRPGHGPNDASDFDHVEPSDAMLDARDPSAAVEADARRRRVSQREQRRSSDIERPRI